MTPKKCPSKTKYVLNAYNGPLNLAHVVGFNDNYKFVLLPRHDNWSMNFPYSI